MRVSTLTRILKGSVYSKRDLRYAKPTPSQHCTDRLTYTRCRLRHVHHKLRVISYFYRTFILMAFSICLYWHTSRLLRFISSWSYSLFISRYNGKLFQFRSIMNWIEFEETWFVILLLIKSYYKFLNLCLFYMILESRKLNKNYYYNKKKNKYWK